MVAHSDKPAPPQRRWLRFSLRTLFVFMIVASLVLGWVGSVLVRVRHQRRMVTYVEARGGRVMYDYQLAQTDGLFVNQEATPPGPLFIRRFLGNDVFAYVEDVGFHDFDRAITDQDLKRIAELPRLKDVWISDGGGVTDEGIQHLAHVRDLRTLILSDANLSPRGLGPLSNKKSLRTLTFHGPWITDESLAAIADLPQLDALSLTRSKVTSVGAASIARMQSLRSLYIREIPGFDDVAMREIATLGNLESLTLRDTCVTDDGFQNVAKLRTLKKLTIIGTTVSDAGVRHLTDLPQLANLHLIDDRIGDGALEVVSRLQSVESLDMSATGISDKGLRHAGAMTNLRFLSIAGTRVSDAGLAHLKRLSNLKRLTLGPVVTEVGAKQLKRTLPECEVILFDKSGSGGKITSD